jgi:hypothetical protein
MSLLPDKIVVYNHACTAGKRAGNSCKGPRLAAGHDNASIAWHSGAALGAEGATVIIIMGADTRIVDARGTVRDGASKSEQRRIISLKRINNMCIQKIN